MRVLFVYVLFANAGLITSACVNLWDQCGGISNTGSPLPLQCCTSGFCAKIDAGGYYYQCIPSNPATSSTAVPTNLRAGNPSSSPSSKSTIVSSFTPTNGLVSTSTRPTTTVPLPSPTNAQTPCAKLWDRCGGHIDGEPLGTVLQFSCCPSGATCNKVDNAGYYYQCQPSPPTNTALSSSNLPTVSPSSSSSTPFRSIPTTKSTEIPTTAKTPVPIPSANFPTTSPITPTALPSNSAAPIPVSSSNTLNFFSTSGAQIVNQLGQKARITGINWMGFESINHIAAGLNLRGYKSLLNQIKQLNFNTVRIAFSNEMLLPSSATKGINYGLNPDLRGLSPLQCLDQIISYCATIDLRVILARYSAQADRFITEFYWYVQYDGYYTKQRFVDDWALLAARYANSAVIGADLWHEPKDTVSWGTGNADKDWDTAATAAGNAILAANPQWLVIVEGTGTDTWWGGNLKGVATKPISLSVPNKLVYSIHEYPQEYYNQPWFSAANYPANLLTRWNSFWGYIMQSANPTPVLVGGFGSNEVLQGSRDWMNALLRYMNGEFFSDGVNNIPPGGLGVSWCYSSINPESSIGGILGIDWKTMDNYKYSFIQPQLAAPLDSFAVNIVSQTAAPTITPPNPAENRVKCVTESFDDIEEVWQLKHFESKGCWDGLTTYKSGGNGFLKMNIFNESTAPYPCTIARIDSKVAYHNAYVESRFKIGGIGPDFAGLVYAFYGDSMNKNVTLHANEIDVEIVGYGNEGRRWTPGTVQLGYWEPFYYAYQHFAQVGPYDLSNSYVTYAYRWNNDTIDFFINGSPVYSSTLFDVSVGYTQAQKVIFSIWDGSPYPDFSAKIDWQGKRKSDYRMDIDYVKICV